MNGKRQPLGMLNVRRVEFTDRQVFGSSCEREVMAGTENARIVVQRRRHDLDGHAVLRMVTRCLLWVLRDGAVGQRAVLDTVHRRRQHASADEDEEQYERRDRPWNAPGPVHEGS